MKIFEMIRNLRYIKQLFRDKHVPMWQKILLVFGFIYILSPIDLIPAPALGFAVIDDIAVFLFAVYSLRENLARYKEKDENGNIHENADYSIVDDKDELPK